MFKQITVMRKQGRVDQALTLLRDALNRNGLAPEEIDRAGRFIQKARTDGPLAKDTLGVQLIGQCTASWLVPALTAVAWGQRQACKIAEGGYDTVLQDLNRLADEPQAPNVIVLVPWAQRLFGSSGPVEDRVEDELTFWRHAWDLVGRMGSRRPASWLRLDEPRGRRIWTGG